MGKNYNLNIHLYVELDALLSSVMIVGTLSWGFINPMQLETQLEQDK